MDDPKKRQIQPEAPALPLTTNQMRELMASGLALGEITTLEARGLTFAEMQALAEAVPQKPGNDADAIAKAIDRTQRRTPENINGPEISDLNPFGDRDNPRPGLKCDWFYGMIDEKTKKAMNSGVEMDPKSLSVWEQMALNVLEPMQGQVERLDGASMPVTVAATLDDFGKVRLMTLAFPANVVGKKGENRNMVPAITDLVFQITGHDFNRKRLSTEETLRLMAEHRKGNYDVPRKAVAA